MQTNKDQKSKLSSVKKDARSTSCSQIRYVLKKIKVAVLNKTDQIGTLFPFLSNEKIMIAWMNILL